MKDARRFTARKSGRGRAALLPALAALVVVGALLVGFSGLVFGAGTASARTNIFIPYWNTAMSHNVPHWDDGCMCYSGYDSVFDGFDRSYMLFPPDNVLLLSAPLPLGPTGTRPVAMTFETFGSTHIKGFNEFQVNAGTPAKFIKTVTAPSGVNGATLSTQSSSKGDSQVVTWSKNGVTVGSPVSVPITYYIDFAAQQKIVCSNGLLSPPIAVQPTLMSTTDGTTSAGRTILEPCKYATPQKFKYTK